jgi:FtsP/CotA-like multicopper oxidase with cupredoxin domain/plastocyanin
MARSIRGATVALVAALALVAVACDGGGGGASAGEGEQAAAAPATVEVMLSDFAIDPSAISVPAGAPVTFSLMNHGPSPHTFAIEVDGETFDSGEIASGATGTLDVPALEAGSYDAYCSVSGHVDLGMTATVTASADATVQSATGAGGATGSSGTSHANMTAAEMAAGHEQGVKDFLAGDQTATEGNQPLEPEMDGDVKVFSLTAWNVKWEVAKGQFVDAMAFNEQIPGPVLRVNLGDRVRIVVENQLDQPFVLHFHGLTVPNEMDGVPYVTQPPAMPGEYWVYEFTVKDPPGMYVYHSHFNSTEQVGKGLYGAIYVQPQDDRWTYPELTVDLDTGATSVAGTVQATSEETLFLGDGPLGYVLNGKSFPATTPIVANRGDWVLIHIANDGAMIHPMHLHGYHFEVVAQDGFPLEFPYMADTLMVAPGQRFDVLVHAIYPGAWAFHCHILPHVEGPQGMYGMVTALVVQ